MFVRFLVATRKDVTEETSRGQMQTGLLFKAWTYTYAENGSLDYTQGQA